MAYSRRLPFLLSFSPSLLLSPPPPSRAKISGLLSWSGRTATRSPEPLILSVAETTPKSCYRSLSLSLTDIALSFLLSHSSQFLNQFPDELLKDSAIVCKALRRELGRSVRVYVMADTAYNSCCIDEIGASYVGAECVVHYGHACMSPSDSLLLISYLLADLFNWTAVF